MFQQESKALSGGPLGLGMCPNRAQPGVFEGKMYDIRSIWEAQG